jgi:hypothetical protein
MQDRQFSKNHFWDALSKCTVLVPEKKDKTKVESLYSSDEDSGDSDCEIDRAAADLAIELYANRDRSNEDDDDVGLYNEDGDDLLELNDHEQEASELDESITNNEDEEDNEEEVDLSVGGQSIGKVRKTKMNPLILTPIIENGKKKMKEMKIDHLRSRMKCRNEREHKYLAEALFLHLEAADKERCAIVTDESNLPMPAYRKIMKTEYKK